MQLRFGSGTDIGLARDHNEDSYGIESGEATQERGVLLVVCDGMGGHAAGEVASRIGVDTILAHYYDDPSDERATALERAFEQANTAIYQHGRGSMGTTGVAALLHHDAVHIANVGDSRAYLIREHGIRQLSRDHSFVSEQVEAGVITLEQARTSQHRNVITRALGYQRDVTVDLFRQPLQVGDAVLLCSDGLHGLVMDDELAEIVLAHPPEDAAQRLIALANRRGGSDNITVVIAHIDALDWDALPIEPEEPAAGVAVQRQLHRDAQQERVTPRFAPVPAASEEPALLATATAVPAAAPARPAGRVERRLTLLGGLLATLLLVVLLGLILFSLPESSTAAPTATAVPASAATVSASSTGAAATDTTSTTVPTSPAATATAQPTAPAASSRPR